MRCSTATGAPRQVEQDEAVAELEVAAFAAALGRHEQARAPRRAGTARPRCRAARGRDPRGRRRCASCARRLELGAQPLERLALGHEHERLLAARFQRGASRASQAMRGSPASASLGPRAAASVSCGTEERRRSDAPEESAGAPGRPSRAGRGRGAPAGAQRLLQLERWRQPSAGSTDPARRAAAARRCRVRRVELVHGGSGSPPRESRLEPLAPRGTRRGAGAGAGGRSPCASSSSGVAVRSSTWRPSARRSARRRGRRGRPGGPAGRRR